MIVVKLAGRNAEFHRPKFFPAYLKYFQIRRTKGLRKMSVSEQLCQSTNKSYLDFFNCSGGTIPLGDYIMQLAVFEEVGGMLEKVWEHNDRVIISFVDKRKYQLPHTDVSLHNKLKNSIGKTINIFRTDVPGQEYFLKIIEPPKPGKKRNVKKATTGGQKNRSILDASFEHDKKSIKSGGT